MARILAIANQKGGVGKTTTAVNLACGLAQQGHRVLLVDLDPQGNATMGAGVEKRTALPTAYQVLLGESDISASRLRSVPGGFDIVPANRELAGGEVEMVEFERREFRLKAELVKVADEYDFILIDCAPTLNLLTVNALAAAHSVLIPMQCEYYALEGLTDLVATIKKVKQKLNPNIEIEGLLRVMYDPRSTLAQQVAAELKSHFGDKVFNTVIPRNVRLAEAPSHGLPGVVYDRASKGAHAYLQLAEELLARYGLPDAIASAN
ncbi:MAG TPA: ParA family protein [Thiobacillaceae bacterium]|nr:ParA family protein [Thiobacillaceae bacterium]